jgi:hypothetical protein
LCKARHYMKEKPASTGGGINVIGQASEVDLF